MSEKHLCALQWNCAYKNNVGKTDTLYPPALQPLIDAHVPEFNKKSAEPGVKDLSFNPGPATYQTSCSTAGD